ncbi:predicted protein [Botrytis cinerea T4]|uniref:Uncharacterized protein n=1 Tax=Botryotinia fuckeliana (strain T4) TaxID=999810 RepID=G2Y9E3_BOTF4|nr:predicted protein [Botrytis cinerea T4]
MLTLAMTTDKNDLYSHIITSRSETFVQCMVAFKVSLEFLSIAPASITYSPDGHYRITRSRWLKTLYHPI